MFIDAHCHINSLVEEEIGKIVSSCRSNHIFIDSSINIPSALKSLQLSNKYPCIYSAIGFHPFSAKEFSETTIADYEKALQQNEKIVAIGEIGLDEFADTALKGQEEIFCHFLALAKKFNLPVIIHNRVSSPHIFDILDKYFASYEKIIFHCFSYSKDFLEKITSKHGFASFSLNVLRKKKDIIESLKAVPLANMLLETDSPYMKIDGRASSPLDIEAVYSFAAAAKNVEIEELKESICVNANKLFQLK
jgi:TatD DNase family protein